MAFEPVQKPLPDGIKLETLKAQAKALQKAFRAGEQGAKGRVERFFNEPTTLKIQQAQLVVARTYGFASWSRLKSFVEARDGRKETQWKPDEAARKMNAEFIRRMSEAAGELHCSFCLRPHPDQGPSKLVAGPEGLICSECVEMCMEIIKGPGARKAKS